MKNVLKWSENQKEIEIKNNSIKKILNQSSTGIHRVFQADFPFSHFALFTKYKSELMFSNFCY